MKSKVLLVAGLIIILILILIGVAIYIILNDENKSFDDSLFCLQDSNCTSQAASCGICACPTPINADNQMAFKCAPLETLCTLDCPLNVPKCLNNECTLV